MLIIRQSFGDEIVDEDSKDSFVRTINFPKTRIHGPISGKISVKYIQS